MRISDWSSDVCSSDLAHVILSRGFAGSERSTAESCNAQAASGHAVLLIVRRSHRDGNGASVLGHLDPRVKVETVPDRLFTGRAIANPLAAFAPDVVHCHLRRPTRIVARTQPPAALIATLPIDFNSTAERRIVKEWVRTCRYRW